MARNADHPVAVVAPLEVVLESAELEVVIDFVLPNVPSVEVSSHTIPFCDLIQKTLQKSWK